MTEGAELPLVMPEIGLSPSPETLLGGVRRLPTLVRLAGADEVGSWEVFGYGV